MIARALSVRQPFVELILQGKKTEEFRSRPTNIRERVYLYAALTERTEAEYWRDAGKERGSLVRGSIVGSVEIVDCRMCSNGEFAYLLANPKRLQKHLHSTNQPLPGFWIPRFEHGLKEL